MNGFMPVLIAFIPVLIACARAWAQEYALSKMDDKEFKNPYDKCYIRVKRPKDQARSRSRSRSRGRRSSRTRSRSRSKARSDRDRDRRSSRRRCTPTHTHTHTHTPRSSAALLPRSAAHSVSPEPRRLLSFPPALNSIFHALDAARYRP